MLVQGTADPTAPLELWRRVMSVLPESSMEVVEGAGHQPWLDDPRTVGAAVQRFLAQPA